MITRDGAVLLERRPSTSAHYPACWDTPGGKIERGESPSAAMRRELHEELGLDGIMPEALTCFDDIDVASRAVVRHHVYAVPLQEHKTEPMLGQELRWVERTELPRVDELAPVALRSFRAWEGRME